MQVAKEPLGTKGARFTSHVSLPGRFLVFMPTVDHIGVSRKIESRDERAPPARDRPRIREQHGFTGGVIIRTAAVGPPEEDILADLELLQSHLDGGAAEDRTAARAGGRLPRTEPRGASCCATC